MRRSKMAWVLVFGAGVAAVVTSGCSDDDTSTTAGGGASGHAGSSGSAGKGGAAGSAGRAGAGSGGLAEGGGGSGAVSGGGSGGDAGTPGEAGAAGQGEGGSAGAGEAAGSGGEAGDVNPCGPQLPLAGPTVAADIAVKPAAVLVAAYAAEGVQTYTCTATTTANVTTYAWSTASVPTANLYGPTCSIAATHYAGPHWKANDGSTILGTKVRGVASVPAGSIAQLLLSTVPDPVGAGLFANVTAVQRLDTVGGVAPVAGCDSTTVSATVSVPYTATYYFYSGADIIPPAP